MKKFLSLMLVFVMVFALAACGSKDGGEDAKTDDRLRPDFGYYGIRRRKV